MCLWRRFSRTLRRRASPMAGCNASSTDNMEDNAISILLAPVEIQDRTPGRVHQWSAWTTIRSDAEVASATCMPRTPVSVRPPGVRQSILWGISPHLTTFPEWAGGNRQELRSVRSRGFHRLIYHLLAGETPRPKSAYRESHAPFPPHGRR